MFKITIEETKSVPQIRNESVLAEERHYTDTELDNHSWMSDEDKRTSVKKVYTPQEVVSTKEVETKVFEQTVEALDLKAVIFAVNKVPDRIMYNPNNPIIPPQVFPRE